MDTKSLNSRQVRWAQELSRYYFRINYWQGKANGAADALSRFPRRSINEEEKLWAENTQFFHCLQSSLTRASLLGLSTSAKLLPLYRILICRTYVLPQLCEFWTDIQIKLADENLYKASIGGMRLRLLKLLKSDAEAQKVRAEELKDGWEEFDGVLHHQGLSFVPEVIWIELISRHYNDLLAGNFGIDKTRELIGWKYYWSSLRKAIEAHVKGCDVCLALKRMRYKPYGNLQLLPVPTHRWKDLSMDFVTGLPVLTNWKGETYDSILVIVDRLTKMVHYERVKVTINAPGLAKVIFDVVVRHIELSNSIVTDRSLLFTSKFWSLLCYFLRVKRRLSTAFYPKTDGQTERQNSTMEVYLQAFVNFKQDDWARLLPIAKFAYNNAKNTSTGHIPFELNCGYHSWMSYKDNVDPCSKSKSVDELSAELRELMIVCQENLHHAQELQKRGHDKGVKPRSYASGNKVWLNSKYIKTKQNRKLEAKFFGPFQVLHPVGKQAYKLELPRKWRIYDVFHVSLLEQDTTRKGQVDENNAAELDAGEDEGGEYELEAIRDSAVYAKDSESGHHLPGLYYLVSWKGYPEEENTWERLCIGNSAP